MDAIHIIAVAMAILVSLILIIMGIIGLKQNYGKGQSWFAIVLGILALTFVGFILWFENYGDNLLDWLFKER